MFGGGPASAEEQKAAKQMANAQVISSFIQFGFAVGLMNLAPYALEAILGESIR